MASQWDPVQMHRRSQPRCWSSRKAGRWPGHCSETRRHASDSGEDGTFSQNGLCWGHRPRPPGPLCSLWSRQNQSPPCRPAPFRPRFRLHHPRCLAVNACPCLTHVLPATWSGQGPVSLQSKVSGHRTEPLRNPASPLAAAGSGEEAGMSPWEGLSCWGPFSVASSLYRQVPWVGGLFSILRGQSRAFGATRGGVTGHSLSVPPSQATEAQQRLPSFPHGSSTRSPSSVKVSFMCILAQNILKTLR